MEGSADVPRRQRPGQLCALPRCHRGPARHPRHQHAGGPGAVFPARHDQHREQGWPGRLPEEEGQRHPRERGHGGRRKSAAGVAAGLDAVQRRTLPHCSAGAGLPICEDVAADGGGPYRGGLAARTRHICDVDAPRGVPGGVAAVHTEVVHDRKVPGAERTFFWHRPFFVDGVVDDQLHLQPPGRLPRHRAVQLLPARHGGPGGQRLHALWLHAGVRPLVHR
mmetsp:Transcript_22283/g.59630  ORF Transcript_22283/g.59630 Transcript_22283/m.59630 type:complete len:222 (+) Transcript_22283:571-1236(+)